MEAHVTAYQDFDGLLRDVGSERLAELGRRALELTT
jgi:hypothetical protein